MRAIAWLILALIVPANAAFAQNEERTVYASVVDKNDAPVPGLTAGAFIVRENDLAREVLRASTANSPLQIALLIDTSQAIDNHLLDLRNALQAFFKAVSGKHEVLLMAVGERPTVLVDLTRETPRLQKAIGQVFARQGSGMYMLDGIVDAADSLRKRKATRPHIVVFAARGPEFSERHHQSVVDRLQETGATLHSLMLDRPGIGIHMREEHELQLSIADGTEKSGGRREDLLTSMALSDRLLSLVRELEQQYEITYARTKTLIPPKSLEVGSKRDDITVRAKRWP
jgi:hypothetical protein